MNGVGEVLARFRFGGMRAMVATVKGCSLAERTPSRVNRRGEMERIKRNPGGWGLALGGTIGIVSVLFSWVAVTNTVANVTSSVPAHRAVSGQTLGLLGLLAVIAGLGVAASAGGGRIWWGSWACSAPASILVAGLVAIFSPAKIAQLFATTELISKLRVTGVQDSASESIQAGFASGELTARVAIGAIIGVAGGALGVLGAILGFGKKRPPADDD